jgi:hypothetical protein
MTYLVGLRFPASTIIIADEMVSRGHERERHALKTGLAFVGTHYGLCGNAHAGREFIIELKAAFDGRVGNLPAIWEWFLDFFRDYKFDPQLDFKLLLSSRNLGAPRLYVLDSATRRIVEVQDDIITLGSGKKLLDPPLMAFHTGLFPDLARQFPAGMPETAHAYAYCLFLMERAFGDEYKELEDAGVGGVFHFGWTDSEAERRQDRAVYFLCVPDRSTKKVFVHLVRVLAEEMALIVECPFTNMRWHSLDAAAWPPAKILTKDELDELRRRLDARCSVGRFYFFLGMGFPRASDRRAAVYTFACNDPPLCDATGILPAGKNLLAHALESTADNVTDADADAILAAIGLKPV